MTGAEILKAIADYVDNEAKQADLWRLSYKDLREQIEAVLDMANIPQTHYFIERITLLKNLFEEHEKSLP